MADPDPILSVERIAEIAYDADAEELVAHDEALRARLREAERLRDFYSGQCTALLAAEARGRELAAALAEAADQIDAAYTNNLVAARARRVLADGGTTDPVPPEVVAAAKQVFWEAPRIVESVTIENLEPE